MLVSRGRLSRGGLRSAAALALVWLLSAGSALAQPVDKIHRRIRANQTEVSRIYQRITTPDQIGDAASKSSIERKVIEGQVQFGVGNFADAALILYDVVESHRNHRSYDVAIYYLAESLFRKKDDFAARTYFERIATKRGKKSKYYQQALERLIELSMRNAGTGNIDRWIAAIETIPSRARRAQVPYIRGKYAHFRGDYEAALRYFEEVPTKSKLARQAAYLAATSHVGLGNLDAALAAFDELRKRPTMTPTHRRIRDLCNMAIGRIHYELDQPSRAIDNYLNVSRRSDLFGDVLYEVAWVYVKNEDYTRALRALELLELTDPKNSKMPEVRILEGNLRIRKAQVQFERQTGNPLEEYDKAVNIFTSTRDAFIAPRDSLEKLIADRAPTNEFMSQIISGEPAFESQSIVLPEVAIAWLRQQPAVIKLSTINDNLEHIDRDIERTNKMIKQIEVAINSSARADVFPELAKDRYRLLDIDAEARADQLALLDQLEGSWGTGAGAPPAKLVSVVKRRKELTTALAKMGGLGKPSERHQRARGRYGEVEEVASEVSLVIESTQAEIAALEVYARGAKNLPANMAEIEVKLAELRKRLGEMRQTLSELREDVAVGKGAAGAGEMAREAKLEGELSAVIEREIEIYRSQQVASSATRGNIDLALAALVDAKHLEGQTSRALGKLDQAADAALAEARTILDQEHERVTGYSLELGGQAKESLVLADEVVRDALPTVASRFSDIVMKSEVGTIDVAWAHKESNEQLRKKLVLDRARERKTLDFEFRDVIEELEREDKLAAALRAKKQSEAAPPGGDDDPSPPSATDSEGDAVQEQDSRPGEEESP